MSFNRKTTPRFCFNHSVIKGKNFHGCKIIDEWNVVFRNVAKTKKDEEQKGRKDTAIDDGGQTRGFLSQCWIKMSGLWVWDKVKPTKLGQREKCVKLFEIQKKWSFTSHG